MSNPSSKSSTYLKPFICYAAVTSTGEITDVIGLSRDDVIKGFGQAWQLMLRLGWSIVKVEIREAE